MKEFLVSVDDENQTIPHKFELLMKEFHSGSWYVIFWKEYSKKVKTQTNEPIIRLKIRQNIAFKILYQTRNLCFGKITLFDIPELFKNPKTLYYIIGFVYSEIPLSILHQKIKLYPVIWEDEIHSFFDFLVNKYGMMHFSYIEEFGGIYCTIPGIIENKFSEEFLKLLEATKYIKFSDQSHESDDKLKDNP